MKKVTTFLVATMLLCCAGQVVQAQTVKQHSGAATKHTDYGNVSGQETYSYYIKDGEQLKHGNYSFNATGELNNPIYQDNIKFSITAAFKDGKFNGPCKATTTGTFHRYTIFNQRELIGSAKSEFSANFKEGELDGLLSITVRDLLADKYAEKWPITEQINIMFKNGKMVGQFDCNYATRSYGEGIQRIKGQFAENGSLTGKWLIEHMGAKAENLRFVSSVLVDNGSMSDEVIQIAEQFATGKLSEKDVEAKGYGVQTRKIYFSLAISHIAGIIDEFGLEEIRETESESRKYFIEERIPIEYKILVSVPFCTNEVFQLICADTNYIKPKYDEKLLAYYVVYRAYDEKGFYDSRAYLTDSRLAEYTAVKEEQSKAKAGKFVDYMRPRLQYKEAATLYELYKESGEDLKQIMLKELSDYSFRGIISIDKDMVAFIEWLEKWHYTPGTTYIFDEDRDGKISAWKVDEFPEFKKFRLTFNQACQELHEELDTIKSHIDWIEQNSNGTFNEIRSSSKSWTLGPNDRYRVSINSLGHWRRWNRLYSLCKQRLANNELIKVKFPNIQEKYKEDEDINKYDGVGVRFTYEPIDTDDRFDEFLDYIDNIVIVQNGYLRWDQLKNKVSENDTKIRSSYQKKTLKPYDSAYKAGMKAISKKPNITDQATAEAECAPLEQLLKEQELFMNSTTPDAQ